MLDCYCIFILSIDPIESNNGDENDPNVGLIVGITVPIVVVVLPIIIIIVIVCWWKGM